MAKIDEIKEILNTLRIALSIAFGLLVVVVGSLINRYDADQTDSVFWAGVIFAAILIVAIVKIAAKIRSKTIFIRDL
ncbi:MAG: hypothetical protein RI556_07155 [Hydrogenovibrio sp.]|uniref:hypothetical protein n=1 Tax=Hydrogenovibrio sp. TaxID=2065821 RepID=UPI00286FCFEE|nr:hypothetical protein [Hydrogenovibrio sp.]MDR9498936.1 hypothetical protein [Hydrogenovibrio sp.]